MIKMVHAVTGVEMWVADDRVETFIKRGHVVEAPQKADEEKPKRKKRTVKKG